MLSALKISKSYGDTILFDGITFNVIAGQRIALIGANGSGKTTLLDILAGESSPDSGKVSRQRNITVGYLKQDAIWVSGKTLIEEVLEEPSDITTRRDTITATYEILSSKKIDSQNQRQLLNRLSELEKASDTASGVYREHEAKVVLLGLGFNQSEFLRPIEEFSGGWRMRAALSKLLLQNPDVLLLDEPTNHLDLDANLWFENYLIAFQGAIVVTSHDRTFLNRISTKILAIEPGEVVFLTGNYDNYLVNREQSALVRHAAAERQDREIQRQMRFVDRFRSKARKATQVQSRLKQLAKIDRIQLPRATKRIHYSFPEPLRSASKVISLNNVTKSYDNHTVYKGINLVLMRGDRVALVGPNGAGKTTTLRILADILSFNTGERILGSNVVTAYYSQHLLDQLDFGNTVIEELHRSAPEEPQQNLRKILGGFLFSGDDVLKPISVLSGGEKARVALAKLLIQRNNLLLMDEPTNHLDLASREILADALDDYKGTICFITHDRTFIQRVANNIIEIKNGQLIHFPGDYESYLYRKQMGITNHSTDNSTASMDVLQENCVVRSGPIKKQLRKDLRLEANQLSIRIKQINEELKTHETQISLLEEGFSHPDQFVDTADLIKSGEQYKLIKSDIHSLSEEWEELSLKAEIVDRKLDEL